MTTGALDVVGIGNALVDVLSHEADDFVGRVGLVKGTATMVDLSRSEQVYAAQGAGTEISGGSAANTVAGLSSFGASTAFVGKVADDQLGRVFTHDLAALGVRFETPPCSDGLPTGRCLVIVTPDAERTMCTYLGVAGELSPTDVDELLVASAAVTYLEGYLWDQPAAKDAFRHAARLAHQAGRRVALTLSDPFCVERHRADFVELIEHEVDVLFANQAELGSLYEVDDWDAARVQVSRHCEIAALTRGPLGSVVIAGDDVFTVDAHPVEPVLDTTGAGDLYAAGFLFGLTRGHDLPVCGKLGSLAAAEIISHLGARPAVSLAELATPLLG